MGEARGDNRQAAARECSSVDYRVYVKSASFQNTQQPSAGQATAVLLSEGNNTLPDCFNDFYVLDPTLLSWTILDAELVRVGYPPPPRGSPGLAAAGGML